MHQWEWDKHCNIALIFNQQNNINKIIKGIIFFKFLTFLVEKMIWGKLSTHGVGGGVFLPGDGSCVCWLVHTGVLHQIPGVTEKGSEKISYLSIKQLMFSVWIHLFVSQHYRLAWNSSLLCVCVLKSSLLQILARIHSKGCSNFSDPEDLENI